KTLAISYEQFLYTKLWDETDDAALDELVLAPMILQRQVEGTIELRVTVIGEQCFAAKFVPHGHVDGRLDDSAIYRAHRLPPQVIEHLRRGRGGSVLLARPVSYSRLTLLFAVVGVGIVAFFVLFSYTRKAHVPGVLLPAQGLIRVQPAQAGVIAERRVREGQA